MAVQPWTRNQLMLAMNLYCRIPFGQFHRLNAEVIKLAHGIGRTPSSVAMKLSNLASLDPYHQERGITGLSGASIADRAIWNEFHSNWEQMSFESERLREELTMRLTLSEPNSEATDSGDTETRKLVKVRLAQRFFRNSILATYDTRCCISGINIAPLLVASHILPWSRFPEHRVDPRNGLCLSRIHDAAFDEGLIAFDEEYRLVLSKQISDATSNEVLTSCFQQFSGQSIRLPNRFRPSPLFLATHREQVFRC